MQTSGDCRKMLSYLGMPWEVSHNNTSRYLPAATKDWWQPLVTANKLSTSGYTTLKGRVALTALS
jgi:hypothetical protein